MDALHFSGGKDSLACLYLHRGEWDKLVVAWVNTGAAYPETVEYMKDWKVRLSYFVEIESNQPAQIKRHGFPADVVPIDHTLLAYGYGLEAEPMLQDYMQCCRENITLPLMLKMKELGITRVIRGTKKADRRKAPIEPGQIIDGVEYLFPLWSWTDADVLAYLKEVDAPIPSYYATEKTSRDCWDCTAYLGENQERIANLPSDRRAVVIERLMQIEIAIRDSDLSRRVINAN